MPVLDFREIASANAGASRDQFELFTRDFLTFAGFKIVNGPDRGADAGRDLIIEEVRTGIAGETRIRWLVSCKHKAHSGASVTAEDEADIHDRVRTHDCRGFLCVYSTLPSSGLAAKINASNLPFEVQVYDAERIETQILSSAQGASIAERYFPCSWAEWKRNHPARASLFSEEPELRCAHCRRDLLAGKPQGIVVIWHTRSHDARKRIEHLYCCCKGQCDRALERQYQGEGLIDGWNDISDLSVPLEYLRWALALLNDQSQGTTYSEQAFDCAKDVLINLFPLIARNLTDTEQERIKHLSMVPSFMGGWGSDV